MFTRLLERSVDYNLAVAAVARRRFGVEIVATTDDVANAAGLLMRPQTYFERIAPAVPPGDRRLQGAGLPGASSTATATSTPVVDFWVDCGIDCLDPIDPAGGYTLGGMKARYGERICLKGNVDCTGASVPARRRGPAGGAAMPGRRRARRRPDPLLEQHDPPRREAREFSGDARCGAELWPVCVVRRRGS